MEIQDIKTKLTLAQVLQYYHLKPDKNHRLCCPFHDDKTPSMQVYYKTHTAFCFSGNCVTHGKAMDVIDFIMNMEQMTKHEAIKKAVEMIGGELPKTQAITDRHTTLTKIFTYFKNGVSNSPQAREYIAKRHLNNEVLEIGFNSGQFHYKLSDAEESLKEYISLGLLLELGVMSRFGKPTYKPFGKHCIVFALRDKDNNVISLYFRSTVDDKSQRHYYLRDRQGLYPHYPNAETKKIILTESIIDAATLRQKFIDKVDEEKTAILALYGTNGLTEEHIKAIKELKQLNEIIFFLNGDEPGVKAVQKHAQLLQTEMPGIKITNVEVPQNEDVNSLLDSHSEEVLIHLINSRKEVNFLFSSEEKTLFSNENKKVEEAETYVNTATSAETTNQTYQEKIPVGSINTRDIHNIYYKGSAADIYVKGGVRSNLDSMKVSVQIVSRESRLDIRAKADLYEYKQVESIIKTASDKLNMIQESLEKDLSHLTEQLEKHRDEILQSRKIKTLKTSEKVPEATIKPCIDFLSKSNLIQNINELIGKSGVVGEDENRLCLFVIASSYKMPDTLHGLIQGSSGSGKTRLLKTICELMPQEDTIKFTRVTDSSFYNYPEDYLSNKLLGFEDIDGLREEALYAVRELISNEILVSSTTTKSEDGQLMSAERTVRGPIASLSCTTKGEIYEDNMSRVFLIAVDESKEQTKKIISYQQQRAAGITDHDKENKVKAFLQNCMRLLKSYHVINPYAEKLQLPEEAHKIRRLNDLYLSFVKQITLLNQYQRKHDNKGRLISTIEDLQTANDILFESIVLKVDELDGSLRQFYEALKLNVKKQNDENGFELREIRQSLHMSKSQLHRYINDLIELGYIQQIGGYANKGYRYKILYWDNIEAIREKIKNQLQSQIATMTKAENKPMSQVVGTPNGTLEAR
jgi:DNA primase